MSVWNSSSLAFSDLNSNRHEGSGLLKNTKERISKQHLAEHKMFGSKRGKTGKDLKIGKKFKKKGKGIMHGAVSAKMEKGGGVSPSVAEFDKMMNKVSGKSSGSGGKKSFFTRKQFG